MSVSSVYTHHAAAVDGIDHKFQMVVHRLPKLSMRVNSFKIRVVSCRIIIKMAVNIKDLYGIYLLQSITWMPLQILDVT